MGSTTWQDNGINGLMEKDTKCWSSLAGHASWMDDVSGQDPSLVGLVHVQRTEQYVGFFPAHTNMQINRKTG